MNPVREYDMAGEPLMACTPVSLPPDLMAAAAAYAIDVFPANAPFAEMDVGRIAVLASKWWGERVRDLTVGFLERPSAPMIDKVLRFANAWGEFSAARFRWTVDSGAADVRVSFGAGGYWSYLGTDCLLVPKDRPTMNLEGFSLNTQESEWHRVVKHEFGHALGCPHEQQRRVILDLLDERKVIAHFMRSQGWTEADVRQQVLTPLEERTLMGASPADQASIMCYQFPGSVTKSGRPIPGGRDFSPADKAFFGKVYPTDRPAPQGEGGAGGIVLLVGYDEQGREMARFRR